MYNYYYILNIVNNIFEIPLSKTICKRIVKIEEELHHTDIVGNNYCNDKNIKTLLNEMNQYINDERRFTNEEIFNKVKELLFILIINANESESHYLVRILSGKYVYDYFMSSLAYTRSWYEISSLIEFYNYNILWRSVNELKV